MIEQRSQVVVVGGGPAGLAAAIALRLVGLEVDVIDRRSPPIDKACGEGLMPAGVRALHALGVSLENVKCQPFQGIRYVHGSTVAEGSFRGEAGLGVRRLKLHEAMVARALELGVRCHWNEVVESLVDGPRGGCEVVSSIGRWRTDWVVGADGLHSRVRGWLGLSGAPARWQRFGVRRHYRVKPWSPFVEVHWRTGCEAYVTPVGDDLVGVAVLWSGRKSSFNEPRP